MTSSYDTNPCNSLCLSIRKELMMTNINDKSRCHHGIYSMIYEPPLMTVLSVTHRLIYWVKIMENNITNNQNCCTHRRIILICPAFDRQDATKTYAGALFAGKSIATQWRPAESCCVVILTVFRRFLVTHGFVGVFSTVVKLIVQIIIVFCSMSYYPLVHENQVKAWGVGGNYIHGI